MFGHIDDSSGWQFCTACAGGDNNADDFWTASGRGDPSLDGSSREFYLGGPPWSAALFYHDLQDYADQYSYATHYLWDFWIYMDGDSMANTWDLEFDIYTASGGREYMMGTHCVLGNGDGQYWEVYSQGQHRWLQSPARCWRGEMASGNWHHIQWYIHRDPDSGWYTYDTLVLDGNPHPIHMDVSADWSDWPAILGVQWQIDTNSNGGGSHEWVDRAKLAVW